MTAEISKVTRCNGRIMSESYQIWGLLAKLDRCYYLSYARRARHWPTTRNHLRHLSLWNYSSPFVFATFCSIAWNSSNSLNGQDQSYYSIASFFFSLCKNQIYSHDSVRPLLQDYLNLTVLVLLLRGILFLLRLGLKLGFGQSRRCCDSICYRRFQKNCKRCSLGCMN